MPNNDAANSNVKDDSSANDSTDAKKGKVAVYKSAQAAKEVSEDKKANVDKNVKDVKGDKELKDNKIATDSAEDRAAKDDKAAEESTNSGEKKNEVKLNEYGKYDFTTDENVTNPFPNVITPDEVKELQDKTTSAYPFPLIVKSFYTPAGKEFKVVNGKPVGDTQEFTYTIQNKYHDMLGRIDNYIFIPRAEKAYGGEGEIRPYKSSREFRNNDGSLSFDCSKAPDTVIPYTLEINGKFIGKDLTTKTPFEYYMHRNQTFVHMTMYGRKDDEIIYGNQSLNYEGSSVAPGLFVFIPECGAQFHFVDDLQYRNVARIEGTGELSQRSDGETDKFSTKSFTKLNITDLQNYKNVYNVKFCNNAIANYFIPLLSYEGDPKKDIVERPTMEELKKTNIPGYLYYSNDIDTPEGGTFTTDNTKKFGNYDYGIVRDKDDNQVTTKHYYVTFRPIPTQLVVQYKDSQNNIESGEKYAIYSGNALVSDTLTSSSNTPTAPTKDELQKMITDKNTSLLPAAAGYFSDSNAYLAPGSYIVKPTAEAPEDYEWVVDSTDIANAPTDANVNIAVHATDDVSTQQVVTFVLRKKIATVTFFDDDDSKPYATVKVQKGSSIDGDELKNQSMPKNPTKPGFNFNGWFTEKDGKGTKFTGNTTVSSNISVHSSYISNPPAPTPTPEPEPEPDIDLTPDKEPEPNPVPVPDFPVPVAPAPILPPAEAEPEPAPAPSQPEQQPKHVAKHLPKTGSTATSVLASAIASLFAGFAGLAESFAANRKSRN
ncbi:InlB B-repeat-containing protein [Gardnerella sp. Marseille-Q9691]|uniref:InlB B-repeat-containing protein n=1 Tax=Gardnerella sp. Marseille-Q9691 TaxID=3390096 RepID=UPI003970B66F